MCEYNDDIQDEEKQANNKEIESDAVLFTNKGQCKNVKNTNCKPMNENGEKSFSEYGVCVCSPGKRKSQKNLKKNHAQV